jgi:hypothetical protein
MARPPSGRGSWEPTTQREDVPHGWLSLRIGSAVSIALYAVFAQLMRRAGAFAVLPTGWSGSPI